MKKHLDFIDAVSELTISVVLYKTCTEDIFGLLKSLGHVALNYKLFIIDNSPTSELQRFFVDRANVFYFHRPDNPGYGAGHNIALRRAIELKSECHLILNADIYFDNDSISPLVDFLRLNKRVGVVAPKILNPDGSVQRLCKLVPTPVDLVLRRFIRKWYDKFRAPVFEMHACNYDKITFVPYLSGCFMLLNVNVIKAVGLFDERYFMYPEDIDLSRRVAERYWTLFNPVSTVYHKHGAGSYNSIKMLFIHMFNIIKYFNKWGWFRDGVRASINRDAQLRLSEFPLNLTCDKCGRGGDSS